MIGTDPFGLTERRTRRPGFLDHVLLVAIMLTRRSDQVRVDDLSRHGFIAKMPEVASKRSNGCEMAPVLVRSLPEQQDRLSGGYGEAAAGGICIAVAVAFYLNQ